MAEAGKTPDMKKTQGASGGNSKKKNKGKKTTPDAASGDGTPSPRSQTDGSSQTKTSQSKEKTSEAANPPSSEAPESSRPPQGAGLEAAAGEVVVTADGAKAFKSTKAAKTPKPQPDQSKKPPDAAAGGGGEQKSKAQLKAERRAIQEAQRAAKEAKKKETAGGVAVTTPASATPSTTVKKEPEGDNKPKPAKASDSKEVRTKKKTTGKIADETEDEMWNRKAKEIIGKSLKIDDSILNLGFQYFHQRIVGANARCVALLMTLKEVIAKYRTPEERELSRDLEKNFLNPCIKYINYCRPLSTSMGNAIKFLKHHINHIPRDMSDDVAIAQLQTKIDKFIEDNIIKAAEGVADYANNKIDDDDVILVYAASSLIANVLKTAHENGKKFRVIVVEGRPRSEGKTMLRALVKCGIPCSYVYIGSASHAMSEATKVLLGAAAMFAIGHMHSRTGNAMVAALAKAYNIPVMVCCETYKFTDKVQLHSDDSNLHARGTDLLTIGHRTPILSNQEAANLGLLNVMYDVTRSEFITTLVTDLGMLPCTSVPVVLRRQEDLMLEG